MRSFGWSLVDIDNTDIETLLPFIWRLTAVQGSAAAQRVVYADEVDWL